MIQQLIILKVGGRTAFVLNGLRKLKTKYQHIAESSVGIPWNWKQKHDLQPWILLKIRFFSNMSG